MKALENVTVLDLTRVLAGPYTGMILADFGANVIKIESPGTGDDSRAFGPFVKNESTYFMSLNRGKKSITLNLKKPEAQEIFKELVKKADVVLENYRTGTMEKFGLGYEELKKINPKIIYSACTGFGHTGPYAYDPAYDVIVQGMGGIMSITGQEGGEPTRVGASVGDITAGLFSAIGVMTALYVRGITGVGQKVDVGMLDCQVAILENAIARYVNTGIAPKPIGNRHPSITPFESFKAQDGYVIIAIGNDNLWKKFCSLVNHDEWAEDERFTTNPKRTEHQPIIKEMLSPVFLTKTVDEWITLLKEAGIPVGPINTVDRVLKDPQVIARHMLVETDHPIAGKIKMAGVPIKLSETPGEVETPSPVLGQHTEEVLHTMLGYDSAKVQELRDKGVL